MSEQALFGIKVRAGNWGVFAACFSCREVQNLPMKLLDYLDTVSINLNISGTTKEDILSELVNLLVKKGAIKDKDALINSLLEREGLGSTGIGHGVAIPHGRTEELEQPAIAFGRSEADVDFDAIDGQPTRLFFLLVAPENGTTQHLHLLAKIARLMKDSETREQLLKLDSAEAVVALLNEDATK